MPFVKTPQRTIRWARVCTFVEREAQRIIPRMDPEGLERRELRGFCIEERNKATAEGYDDTAQYLQHIIDDLEPKPRVKPL
jgi:hypothetical protein